MNTKNYLKFNEVPVLLVGFNRPDFIKARVGELSRMPIDKLYISLDGGYTDSDKEMQQSLDWSKKRLKDIHLFQIYKHEKNLGLVTHITSIITNLLNQHSHLIIVEDDIALADNFFVNMVRGFNYQIKTGKCGIVGGFSATNLSKFRFFDNKWRESKYSVIWGWGCSAENWSGYNNKLDEKNLERDLGKSKTWANLSTFQQEVWRGRFYKTIVNPNFTWDIQLQYLSFIHDFVNLYPLSTLTKNIGYSDERSTNTKNRKPNWMSVVEPDNRIVSEKKVFYLTKKFFEIFDANVFMSDTKIINWWKHKKNYQILKFKFKRNTS